MHNNKPITLPDPWDPATGMLIDKWLGSLQGQGCTSSQLEIAARTLGRASNRGWYTDHSWETTIVEAFLTWAAERQVKNFKRDGELF